MSVAFVQANTAGLPTNRNCHAAYEGFTERGFDVRLFRLGEGNVAKVIRSLGLTPETVVHGTIPVVHEALRTVGAEPPGPLDYPESLRPFLGRRIWLTTLEEVREPSSWPVFAKPSHQGKGFTGQVIKAFRNLLQTSLLPDDYPIWASEVIPFHSEWRVFVLRGEVLDVRPYGTGPFRKAPSQERIEAMIASFSEAPVAYALDVGVSSADDETYLVEVNDSYSLGTYGLEPMLYAKMIHARWEQLTGG